jgi:hypothetical protein
MSIRQQHKGWKIYAVRYKRWGEEEEKMRTVSIEHVHITLTYTTLSLPCENPNIHHRLLISTTHIHILAEICVFWET